MITGLHATLNIIGAGFLTEAPRDYEPARAADVKPACRVLVLLRVREWRLNELYPRPEISGLLPHRN